MAGIMTMSEAREIYPRPEGAAAQNGGGSSTGSRARLSSARPSYASAPRTPPAKPTFRPAANRLALCKSSTTRPCSFRSTGKNHLDSIENIIANPNVDLHLLRPVPRKRLNGRPRAVDDPSVLAAAALPFPMSRYTGEISPKAAGGATGRCAKPQAFAIRATGLMLHGLTS
jgi:hypothetical protein